MHFGLTDEQQMIVDTVRSFVENEIYPHEELVERTGEVPEEIAQDIKQKTIDLGFYACNSLNLWAVRGLAIWNSHWLNGNWAAALWR